MKREWSILRETLIRYGLRFYRRHMKSNWLGRLVGRQVLRRGLIKPADIIDVRLLEEPVQAQAGSVQVEADFAVPGFHLSPPLNVVVSDALATRPAINVLLPSLKRSHMSGGPNTALILAALLAERGERIRMIACDASADGEEAALYDHMDGLLGRLVSRDLIQLVDGFDRSKPVAIGLDDIFLATAWWTAQIAKYALANTVHNAFIYLIQDFEPILHEGGTFQARALETYSLDHIPVINTKLLFDHLVKEEAGRFADPDFAKRALWFEPALDRKFYFPKPGEAKKAKKKTLLFYARPSVARRNLFELGVVALRQAVASGNINKDDWDVWAMGEKIPPVNLGNGVFLNPLPWMTFDEYARSVRTADLMLSLMLSPHPSYPPLEMAASGNLVVTNSFSVKTSERLQSMSRNILVARPTAESIAASLEVAVGRINAGMPSNDPSGSIALPLNWDGSLNDIVEQLIPRLAELRSKRSVPDRLPAIGLPAEPKTAYETFRRDALTRRRRDGTYQQQIGLLSFVTSVYNTDPKFLDELASSLFLQDGGTQFEWFILDNGSTVDETVSKLREIGRHAGVRLERVEANLGIVGGMRYCLERATGRYILPLDSDDLLDRDCVNVVTRYLQENVYPALVYTDEDKLNGESFTDPYFKPNWDPVLFLHSCYIAHLCAIDRELALQLQLYTDNSAEGCHDWDSFIRFMNAGYTPLHIPEALYSWRMHDASTSSNIASKSYITQSHAATLQRALDQRDAPHLKLVTSPLFNYGVDWWYRRERTSPVSMATLVIESRSHKKTEGATAGICADDEQALQQLVDRVTGLSQELVHLLWDGILPDTDEWMWDSAGLLEMFPDAVMIGGTLHDNGQIVDGARIFGFGEGYDCPDRGRPLTDPGYSAAMWKAHSVSAVSSGHCVVRRAFLLRAMPVLLAENVPLHMVGPWLGALAAEQGGRIVFSPFMAAQAVAAPEDQASREARAHFLSRFWSQMPDTRFYSPRLGLTLDTAYTPTSDEARANHLRSLQQRTMSYENWLTRELQVRASRYPRPVRSASISVLTPVYSGSNLVLLEQLAEAIASQTEPVHQWILIVNGPMPDTALQAIRAKATGDWNAHLIVRTDVTGIVPALRLGLESASSDYVVPVDADDLITPDAVQILVHELDRLNRPDFLYSDEDVLIDGIPTAPYLRAAYDPLLSLDNSTIWHVCAMKRDAALAAGVYSDAAANWCQDWDSVSRITGNGGRIEHVPEVLYHWRHHAGSTTNNAEGDVRSLESVRHILERHIAHGEKPENYHVVDWPVNRGARELYIGRRHGELPPFIWIGDALNDDAPSAAEDAILVYATDGVSIDSAEAFVEAARLFELHPRLGVVGGNVVNHDGVIVDGCYVVTPGGALESPWIGRLMADAGPFALALKTQSVALPGGALAFFRVTALRQAGMWPLDTKVKAADLVWQWCDGLVENDWIVGFSPLVKARVVSSLNRKSTVRLSPAGKTWPRHAFARYGSSRNFSI